MREAWIVFALVIAGPVLGLIWLAYDEGKAGNAFHSDCHAKGGYVIEPRGMQMCLRNGLVIGSRRS